MRVRHFIYFLRSSKDGKYYIGCTSRDPKNRLIEHNAGKVRSTRNRRPLKLVYVEELDSQQEALKREWHLKHPKGYQDKLAIIEQLID